MEIKKSITINITEAEIRKLIVDHIKEKGYTVSEDDLEFVLKTKLQSYSGCHYEQYLDSCRTTIILDKPITYA